MKERRQKEKPEKEKLKTWFRRIALAFLGMFLGVELYFANAKGILGNELPMPFGFGTAVVLSGSMEPTLEVDDLIIVKQKNDVDVGDVVVYQSGRSLVVHRIVRFDDDMVITKGDANGAEDKPFEKNLIKGVMIARIPHVGRLFRMLKTPIGGIAALALAIFLTEFSYRKQQETDDDEIEAIKEEIRRLKEEKKKDENNGDNDEKKKQTEEVDE